MRFFLQDYFSESYEQRREFLYDISNLYWVPKQTKSSFLCLQTFPFVHDNICIVYGHNYAVFELISSTDLIYEKNIYIISCAKDYRNKYLKKNKNVFIAPQGEHDILKPYISKYFGFNFDITDVELNLFNCREKDFQKKLDCCFELLEERENERLS